MKMKSKFFGLSAKLALAILAVGTTLTSCYDSENVDIVAPSQPEPATYVIVGNITDAATGLPLSEGVAVTVDGNAQTVNASGYFEATGLSAGSHEVKVSAPTYNDAVRTIYLAETAEGGVCVGNADFALYTADASADLVYPDGGYEGDGVDAGKPATKEQAEAMLAAVEGDILAAFNGVADIDLEAISIKVDENGNTVLTAPAEVSVEVGESKTVVLPYFEGFASSIAPETDNIFTKAVTDGQIWLASAENQLGMSYGMTARTQQYTIPGVAGKSIAAYTLTILFKNRILSFQNAEGTVMYQSTWSVEPVYESHDSHDSHNSHGNSNGAGGGNSNQGF